jgi:hypothetical protein
MVRDGVLERHWQSAKGRSKIAQIVIPWSKVKEVLGKLLGGSTGVYIYIMSRKHWTESDRFYWLHARNDMER